MNLGGSQSYDHHLVKGLGLDRQQYQQQQQQHHHHQQHHAFQSEELFSNVTSLKNNVYSSFNATSSPDTTEQVSLTTTGEGILQGSLSRLNLSEWQLSQLQGLTPNGITCLLSNWLSLAKNPIERKFKYFHFTLNHSS